MIPPRLIRTVPAKTTAQVEAFWAHTVELHPGWEHVTYRDPIDRSLFPLTSQHWRKCKSGAQMAGLIRLEALWHHGGIYLDSDYESYRSLEPLLQCQAFAAWEDARVIPDAVMGAEPKHPAIGECLERAVKALPQGAWKSGPGVTTAVLQNRPDVLILGPSAFYEVHYKEKVRLLEPQQPKPWQWGQHHWHASWVKPK